MDEFTAACNADPADTILVYADVGGESVGVKLNHGPSFLNTDDARRLRDWLTGWLSERDEEPEEGDDPEGDGEALGLGIPLSRWAHRLHGLQQRAVDAAEVGNSTTASACMAVHDWLAAMVFDDTEADGD